MIVLDASAMMELLFATPTGTVVARRLGNDALAAPALLIVECLQVLRRFEQRGELAAARAEAMLDDLLEFDITLYEHHLVAKRVWKLRGNLTAYDATYVALSELLRAPLVTTDANLAHSPGNHAAIELIGLA